jgi:hypothetical protein
MMVHAWTTTVTTALALVVHGVVQLCVQTLSALLLTLDALLVLKVIATLAGLTMTTHQAIAMAALTAQELRSKQSQLVLQFVALAQYSSMAEPKAHTVTLTGSLTLH